MMALPSVDEAENQGLISSQDEVALSLYSEVVLPAEKAATEASNSDNAVASRIIGYLLLYPPSDDARATLKSEIELCKDESDVDQNEAVYDLGDTYFKYFIQVFFRTGTREPSTPDSEGWDESSKSPNCYALLMAHIPGRSDATLCARDHAHAKAAVLARDNFRCLLSGKPDARSYWKRFITEVPPGRQFAKTDCCYIFPNSLGDAGARGVPTMPKHTVRRFWAILKQFGYEYVCNELNARNPQANLRRTENIMTLDLMIHQGFNEMYLWLEEVPGERDTYHIRLAGPMTHEEWGIPEEIVRFTSHTGDPLPSPAYLQIHAACCRIATMSGAADCLVAAADEKERIETLDEG